MLVIEDDADTRWMLADVLTSRGYDADTSFDGTQALKKLAGDPPDLVTLDLNMPLIDGGEVLERMRSDLRGASVPVLILSGAMEAPEWARRFKNVSFLRKPFEVSQLMRRVEEVLPPRPNTLPPR